MKRIATYKSFFGNCIELPLTVHDVMVFVDGYLLTEDTHYIMHWSTRSIILNEGVRDKPVQVFELC